MQEIGRTVFKDFYKMVLMMQEEEKKRLSRDIHDETGQISVALGAGLNVIEREIKRGNFEKALSVVEELRKMVEDIATRMKSMAQNIRPPALDLLGLPAVLRDYFAQCTKSNDIKIEFVENLKDTQLKGNVEITLYRIVQEAITNVLKHSSATELKVELMYERRRIRLVIEDNGKGFDTVEFERKYNPDRMGLYGIKERVSLLNGEVSIDSSVGKGMKLIVALNTEE